MHTPPTPFSPSRPHRGKRLSSTSSTTTPILDAAQTLLKRCQQHLSIGHLPLQFHDTAAQERTATCGEGRLHGARHYYVARKPAGTVEDFAGLVGVGSETVSVKTWPDDWIDEVYFNG